MRSSCNTLAKVSRFIHEGKAKTANDRSFKIKANHKGTSDAIPERMGPQRPDGAERSGMDLGISNVVTTAIKESSARKADNVALSKLGDMP